MYNTHVVYVLVASARGIQYPSQCMSNINPHVACAINQSINQSILKYSTVQYNTVLVFMYTSACVATSSPKSTPSHSKSRPPTRRLSAHHAALGYQLTQYRLCPP